MQSANNSNDSLRQLNFYVRRSLLLNRLLLGILCLFLAFSFKVYAQSAPFTEMTSVDIKNQMHNDEYTLIEVNGNSMPILISLSQQPITKGVVMIIGDADTHLGKKESLVHIAEALPAFGWTTVVMPSLGLQSGPNIPPPIVSEDPASEVEVGDELETAGLTNEETAKATDEPMAQVADPGLTLQNDVITTNSRSIQPAVSEAQLIVYSQEVDAYLDAVMQHMEMTMGHRVVVAQGVTAATIAKLVVDKPSSNIDTLVINNPYWPIRKLNNKVPMIIAQTPIPVLDITSYWDNNWSKQTESKREISARTGLKEVYRQVEIAGQSFDQRQMEYIARQIKGWTTFLGW
jgi:hypothetical protein